MRLIPLGKTGIKVSRLCFGSLTLGPLQANMELEAGAGVLARAIECGVNFCDTAQLYETYQYIKRAMELTGRYDIVVSTKTYAHTRELAMEAVEQAREELNRDYIDVFMLHEQESVHTLNGHRDALEYLYECKQKGIIRAVGASMHHVAAVYGAVEKELDVIHPILNIRGLGIADGARGDMEEAVRLARWHGIGTFAMKAIGGGNLFKQTAECLKYIMGLDYIDAVAVGMQSADEVDANINFFETGAFSAEARKKLEEKSRKLHIDDWCEGCGACEKRCGQHAIFVKDGRAVCDHEKCVLCGYCSAVCPAWAVKVV